MDLIKVDTSKCVKCGLCVADCPACILTMGKEGPECNVDHGCMSCGHCVAICPVGAMDNKYTPFAEMLPMPKVLPDREAAYNFLRARRSVRLFQDRVPSQDDVLQLLDICRYAPTASNSQGMYYTIISNKDAIKKITDVVADWMQQEIDQGTERKRYLRPVLKTYRERGIDIIARHAPMLIFSSVRRLNITGASNADQCWAYAELYAPVLGLGTTIAGFIQTCGMTGYQPLLDLVGIPPKHKLVGTLMVGYPRVKYQRLPERQHLKYEFKD